MPLIHLQLKPELVGATYWDQTLLIDLFKDTDKDIVLVPGALQADLVDDISMELAQYPNPTVIITSDEEHQFPVEELYHPNMNLYVQMPDPARHKDIGCFPLGYTPKTRKEVTWNGPIAKTLDWFFAGQVSPQRQACVEVLRRLPMTEITQDLNGKLITTSGFAQGLEYKEYMEYMCQAKVVLCPIGNVSPDSFRVYEALEAGAVPIVENREFWTMLFGEVPFPVLDNWEQLPGYLVDTLNNYPVINNHVQAWWQRKKRDLQWMI